MLPLPVTLEFWGFALVLGGPGWPFLAAGATEPQEPVRLRVAPAT